MLFHVGSSSRLNIRKIREISDWLKYRMRVLGAVGLASQEYGNASSHGGECMQIIQGLLKESMRCWGETILASQAEAKGALPLTPCLF